MTISLAVLLKQVVNGILLFKFRITRLLGRFAPIFYLNCEHVLFVYILKQRRKKCCGFKKKIFADFQEFKFFYKIKSL